MKIRLPLIITYLALGTILASIWMVLKDVPWHLTLALALVALLLDVLDGYLARKLNLTSELGKQLDSFADVFIYLIYPVLVYLRVFNWQSWFSLSVYLWFLCTGIFRLARFNLTGFTQLKQSLRPAYQGMPVYMNYLLLALLAWWPWNTRIIPEKIINIILIISGLLMVSKIKFIKPQRTWLWVCILILAIIALLL